MIASLALAAAAWSTAITNHCLHTENAHIIGIAENTNNEFLYCEIFIIQDEQHIAVNYEQQGKIFATKKLNYSYGLQTPAVKQIDSRSGEIREAIIDQQQLLLNYQETNQSKAEKVSLLLKDADVIDAGFNAFINIHWDELLNGKMLSLHFASMSHQKLLPLRVTQKNIEKCKPDAPNEIAEAHQLYCFSVEIDNALLRLILGNIKLTYNNEKQLIKYEGAVNINDIQQKTQRATIRYYYLDDIPALSDHKKQP